MAWHVVTFETHSPSRKSIQHVKHAKKQNQQDAALSAAVKLKMSLISPDVNLRLLQLLPQEVI